MKSCFSKACFSEDGQGRSCVKVLGVNEYEYYNLGFTAEQNPYDFDREDFNYTNLCEMESPSYPDGMRPEDGKGAYCGSEL